MVEDEKLIGTKFADRYCITGTIGSGGMGSVYRAMPFADPSQDVAIKLIRSDQNLGSDVILRFQKEAALMSRLHHPNIICFHELGLFHEEAQNLKDNKQGYYIVMEIANGRNLKESLAIDSRKDLAFFFEVGLQVTAALDYTHGKNITHQDIKPQNIIVGKAWQEQRGIMVKVLDFGVAKLTEVTNIAGSMGSTNRDIDVVGTPMYMAPELTPYLNATVDHRVDLYSLGCVLYEILAGKTPFSADSREKLMRHHVNTVPEPLTAIRPDVPKIIESIVHKLLSKHPDDRYQTAFGLLADLKKAKSILTRRSRSSQASFQLGTKDAFKAVSGNLKMMGRDTEFSELQKSYKSISEERGRSRLSVIKGSAGVGKTRLLTEFRSYLANRKIRYVSTSFSRHENNLPFNALANGFNEYLIRLLKSNPYEAEELRRKIKALLGPMVHQVAQVVPGLKAYISDEIEDEEVGEEEQSDGELSEEFKDDFQTFAKAFSDFTRCLAVDNQPVVFIFDDMQWADDKSLELIDQFFSHNNSQRFFMVIGYRPLGSLDTESFKQFLLKFRKLRRRFQEIQVENFDSNTIRMLVGNMMGSNESVNSELVEYLFEKTNGNPMYLVELLRSLVAEEKITVNPKTGTWEYSIQDIRNSFSRLDSVDLTLSRMQNYHPEDRNILEIAATIGMSFQFELLLLDGSVQITKARKALQLAIDEGLIFRSTDDEELKHMGKTYTFVHRRAREAIHDEIPDDRKIELHKIILMKLEKSVPNPSAKTIFTLAHHVNIAISGKGDADPETAERGISHNIRAGRVAASTKSWLSAQRYYENAYSLLKAQPLLDSDHKILINVVERLVDIAIFQSRHSDALKMLYKLLKMNLPRNIYAKVIHKCVNLQIVKGFYSIAMKEILQGFKRLKMPIPKAGFMTMADFISGVIYDVLPFYKKQGRLFKLLNKAYNNGFLAKKNKAKFDCSGIELYHHATIINLRDNPLEGLLFQDYALKMCMNNNIPPSDIINLVGDRAVFIGSLGFVNRGYFLLDIALDVAESLGYRRSYGYILMLRTLTLDHFMGKHEEVEQNIIMSLESLSKDYDQIYYAICLVYLMWFNLYSGDLDKVVEEWRNLSRIIPVRNTASPKGAAIYLFALFLQGSRDLVVKEGEAYLRKRKEANGRFSDIYVRIIQCIVGYVKGETDRTKHYFTQALKLYRPGYKGRILLPFEEDFLAFFMLTFPELFLQEHGRFLLSKRGYQILIQFLKKRMSSFKSKKRSVSKLVLAKIEELMGGENVKRLYDEAILLAKVDNNILVNLFSYLWFGKFLLTKGSIRRKGYLFKVQKGGVKHKLYLLVDLAERVLKSLKIPFESVKQVEVDLKGDEDNNYYEMSEFLYRSLITLSEIIDGSVSLVEGIKEFSNLLEKHYRFLSVSIYLIQDSDKLELVYQAGEIDSHKGVISYINPYINIRSSLFLPISDAPWIKHTEDSQFHSSRSNQSSEFGRLGQTTASSDFGSTELVEFGENTAVNPVLMEEGRKKEYASSSVVSNNYGMVGESSSHKLGMQHLMNTLIPTRHANINRGLIFLEENNLRGSSTARLRQDFDQFGALIGLLIGAKQGSDPIESSYSKIKFHETGCYYLEDVDWLDIWSYGKLRKDRESTWYTGLNLGSDFYLLVYCRLNGPEQNRMQLSNIFWYYTYILRSIAYSSGCSNLTISEVREEFISIFRARKEHSLLEGVSLSFTIFSREDKNVFSGHFGPSRPLVLQTKNEVAPSNEIVLNLNNGRALRYWEVKASIENSNLYILPHDSSKLEGALSEEVNKTIREIGSGMTSNISSDKKARLSLRSEKLHNLLNNILMSENVPRYYVAASFFDDKIDSDQLKKAQ